jgi:hypothetical protein
MFGAVQKVNGFWESRSSAGHREIFLGRVKKNI